AVAHSFASMAAFPATKSGSSCVPAGPSLVASAPAVAGSRTSVQPSTTADRRRPRTPLLARHAPPHSRKLGTLAFRVLGEACKLVTVLARLLRVAGGLRRLGRSVEAAQAHRRILERGLVFLECLPFLALQHQHVAEQLAHGVEAVLHSHVFLAGVLQI